MSLVDLFNQPRSEQEWSIWSFAHRDSHTRIREAIQNQTGNITAIPVTSNGSGYTSAPTVAITDVKGNGKGATAVATYTVTGGFYNITIAVLTQGSGYLEPIVMLSGGGGTGATAQAEYRPVTILTEYQLDPINFNDFTTWLENNEQSHDDFNAFLKLQSSDLEEVDPKNESQMQAWINLHFREHQSAESALNI